MRTGRASTADGLEPGAAAVPVRAGGEPARAAGRLRPGLSARLLALTTLFVMLAEVLIYVPSVANFRRNWLNDRLAAAQVAALVLDAAPSGMLPPDLANRLLAAVGARVVAVRAAGARRLLAMDAAGEPPPSKVARVADLRDAHPLALIRDAFAVLLDPVEDPIRVIGRGTAGSGSDGVESVEILIDEAPLRQAMLAFSRNILLLSLVISGITAGLVYLALQWVIVRPVRRLTGHIAAFAEAPEDASRIVAPSARTDEIGVAERALARMQHGLAGELRARRRLAELGLAVAKINHELRNMLTTAQLLTDRLEAASDPAVQRVAPRLMATIGRAIAFCQATLAYGRLSEQAPARRMTPLAPLLADLEDQVGAGAGRIAFALDVPEGLAVDADPEQLQRVLVNLVRNAAEALHGAGTPDPLIRLAARREGGQVTIRVEDNGPGVPERARAHLFEPFQGSARPGGTGLGLAVAAELVRLHGGAITLLDRAVGAGFQVTVPDRR